MALIGERGTDRVSLGEVTKYPGIPRTRVKACFPTEDAFRQAVGRRIVEAFQGLVATWWLTADKVAFVAEVWGADRADPLFAGSRRPGGAPVSSGSGARPAEQA